MSVKHNRTCPRSRRGGRECTCGSEPLLYPGWEQEAREETERRRAEREAAPKGKFKAVNR